VRVGRFRRLEGFEGWKVLKVGRLEGNGSIRDVK
jgi:hypothetical protein